VIVKETKNYEEIKEFFYKEPKLFHSAFSLSDLEMYDKGTWKPRTDARYLRMSKNKKLLGFLRFEEFTSVSVIWHWYLSSEHWGSGITALLDDLVVDWFKHNTYYHKIIGLVPEKCKEVIKAGTRAGMLIEGCLIGGVHWGEDVCNLVIMSKFIKRV